MFIFQENVCCGLFLVQLLLSSTCSLYIHSSQIACRCLQDETGSQKGTSEKGDIYVLMRGLQKGIASQSSDILSPATLSVGLLPGWAYQWPKLGVELNLDPPLSWWAVAKHKFSGVLKFNTDNECSKAPQLLISILWLRLS